MEKTTTQGNRPPGQTLTLRLMPAMEDTTVNKLMAGQGKEVEDKLSIQKTILIKLINKKVNREKREDGSCFREPVFGIH